jgi:hypothetical protein
MLQWQVLGRRLRIDVQEHRTELHLGRSMLWKSALQRRGVQLHGRRRELRVERGVLQLRLQ